MFEDWARAIVPSLRAFAPVEMMKGGAVSLRHTHAWRRLTRSIRQCVTCERFELIQTPEPGTRDDDWNDDDDESSNDEDEDDGHPDDCDCSECCPDDDDE